MKNAVVTAIAAAVLTLAVLAVPAVSAAAQADVLRQVQDRDEIEALMWKYNRALDTLNADAYAAVFTPDGAFGDTKGAAALKKMIVDTKKGFDERTAKGNPPGAMHHVEMNEHLEFIDRDHARLHYYWMTVFGAVKQGDPARVAAVDHGVDDLVRVNGKWLIKLRNVRAKDE